jgi:SAM-dependent methyltransferase
MHDRWLGVTNTVHLNSPIVTRHSGYKGLFCVDPTALPFQNDSIDLIVLPHTLDWSTDAHATLREAARVVRPEGRVILLGFNPLSLWAIKQLQTQILSRFFSKPDSEVFFIPHLHRFLGHWRLLDWLRLLDFDIEELTFGVHEPALQHEVWIQRWSWINKFSQRWWPMFGAVYLVIATKKVHSMRLLGPAWHRAKTLNSVASAT